MNFSYFNKYIYNSYKNILINNNFVIFCCLDDILFYNNLRKDALGKGFLVKKIKNKIFRNLFINNYLNLFNLFNGSVFILYKKNLNSDKDSIFLKTLVNSNFEFYCLINQKPYESFFFENFKNVQSKKKSFSKLFMSLNTSLVKLDSLLNQLSSKDNIHTSKAIIA